MNKIFQKKALKYLDCILKSRTFAPAFRAMDGRLAITKDAEKKFKKTSKNIWRFGIKVRIFAVRCE